MTVTVKNTDRAGRPADLSDGRQIPPGEIGDAPDDDTTTALLDSGWLTKVLHASKSRSRTSSEKPTSEETS